ncbi:uncharacterized protein LOC115884876 [Sitophilus oryzae]|uniref:Uncharacterized protein LOC115884876 n=1 Tax=Sitophilus oryzae TaxID=7048 RepID=A0A6J2Y6H8_SITOR|nr:uncharacterized protein LOC115884876 [Sitophilus oryzae]
MNSPILSRNLSLTSKLGHRLIKFRYGPHRNVPSGSGTQSAQSSAKAGSKTQGSSAEAIWDFQIPARWRRAPLSEEECAVINNGGPL